jgi:predicted permease
MQALTHIITNNIAPIFVLIFAGYVFGKKLPIDVSTLSKAYFYVFLPGFLFSNLYEAEFSAAVMSVLVFIIVFFGVNFVVSQLVGRWLGFGTDKLGNFANAVMFYNSGNLGIPLITLTFAGSPYQDLAVAAQLMVAVFQNIVTNSVGVFNIALANSSSKALLKKILCMPSLWMIPAALLARRLPMDLREISMIWVPLKYVSGSLFALALLTLGAQLSRSQFSFGDQDVYFAVFMRLLVSPALAFVVLKLMGITGVLGQILLISSSVPTSISTALIALEFKSRPDFASQIVLVSTVLSALSLAVIIPAARLLFPY